MLIYTSDEYLTEGLFACITSLFRVLPILEKNNIDPATVSWNIATKNYGPIFPNTLEFKKNTVTTQEKLIDLKEFDNLPYKVMFGDDFHDLNRLFFKYFSIPKCLNDIAISLQLQDYLGIHFRGTDRQFDDMMTHPMLEDEFYIIIDNYIKLHNITKIFLATDNANLYKYLIKNHPTIHIKTARPMRKNLYWRFDNKTLLRTSKFGNPNYGIEHNQLTLTENAKYAMIDMLCLSKCHTVLKSSSALSAYAKIINPDLKIYRINACKMFCKIPYFPDAYIPLLHLNPERNSESGSILKTIQQEDWSHNFQPFFKNFAFKYIDTNIF